MKILLVDDEPSIRLPFKSLLERIGHTVDVESSAESAIVLLDVNLINHRSNYDLVITDYDMTGMTGVDVIEKTKKVSTETTCWLMTGYLDEERLQRALSAGASRVFQKPVAFDQLKEELVKIQK